MWHHTVINNMSVKCAATILRKFLSNGSNDLPQYTACSCTSVLTYHTVYKSCCSFGCSLTWTISVNIYQTKRHHIPGDSALHRHFCDNLKSNIILWPQKIKHVLYFNILRQYKMLQKQNVRLQRQNLSTKSIWNSEYKVPLEISQVPALSSAAQLQSQTETAPHATDVSAVVLPDDRCAPSTLTCQTLIAMNPTAHRHRVYQTTKGNIKLSLFLINQTLYHEDILGCEGTAPSFLTSALDGGELVSSIPRPLYPPLENRPWYPLDRRRGGPQSRSRCCEEKNLAMPGIAPRP
jgi:hypothetical protein